MVSACALTRRGYVSAHKNRQIPALPAGCRHPLVTVNASLAHRVSGGVRVCSPRRLRARHVWAAKEGMVAAQEVTFAPHAVQEAPILRAPLRILRGATRCWCASSRSTSSCGAWERTRPGARARAPVCKAPRPVFDRARRRSARGSNCSVQSGRVAPTALVRRLLNRRQCASPHASACSCSGAPQPRGKTWAKTHLGFDKTWSEGRAEIFRRRAALKGAGGTFQ